MSALANALATGQVYWPSPSDKTDAAKICFCPCGWSTGAPRRFRSYANMGRFKRTQLAGCCCTCSKVANLYKLPSTCTDILSDAPLPAPTIDFANTMAVILEDDSIDVTITWFPVGCALSYKVFYINEDNSTVFLTPDNQPVTSLNVPKFTNDSGPLTATTVTLNIPEGSGNFYVYSYINGVRGYLPTTQVYVRRGNIVNPNKIELWPTLTITPIGSPPLAIPITCANLYTGESVIVTPAEQLTNPYPNLPAIHGDVALQSKTF